MTSSRNGSDTAMAKARLPWLADIRHYDKQKLRSQMVYFANRSQFGFNHLPADHGVVIIGNAPTKYKRGFAKVLSFTISPMHVPFFVTQQMADKVQGSRFFSADSKRHIKQLIGVSFPSTEHFFRALLTLKFKPKTDADHEKVLFETISLNAKSKEVLSFNTLNVAYNKNIGGGIAIDYPTGYSVCDQTLFENGASTLKAFPDINPDILQDIFHQQILFIRYIEEKAGIGKAISPAQIARAPLEVAKQKLSLIPAFTLFPTSKDMFTSNCNKAAATLLQMAEIASAQRAHRAPKRIKGSSIFAFGASQRTFLWAPLGNQLRYQLLQLIENPQAVIDTKLFIQNRKNILHFIATLSLVQQKQCLDEIVDPASTLGKIFRVKKDKAWFTPKETSRSLTMARQMLADVNARLNSINAETKMTSMQTA